MKYTIRVITRLQDNQDGGFSMRVYNSEEEMLADHPLAKEWCSKLKKDVPVELSEEKKREILTGDDEYENGYLGEGTIEIEVIDGVAQLSEPLYFHGGQ